MDPGPWTVSIVYVPQSGKNNQHQLICLLAKHLKAASSGAASADAT